MKKKKYILLVSEIHEKISPVIKCSYGGKQCLFYFIKTREKQPDICLHCLDELGEKENLSIIIYGKEGTIW